ncbi:MAG: SpoIIE family protein phosphatase [Gammaproteobacteria bacterium]|nr:SpoIIE family protein phosphatase [Gammaproteobacteria bacterium]
MNRLLLETAAPSSLEKTRELRHLLDQVTETCVPHTNIRRRMLLCLSEAATNLVMHGEPRASRIIVRFGQNSSGWWLEILDDANPWDPTGQEQSDMLSSFEDTEHGRGIGLLQTQCDQMEYWPGDGTQPNRLRLVWTAPKKNRLPAVLVVEDDNALRRLYAAYLSDDFDVHTASNGQEALQQLKNGGVDLVLSDIRMPQMSGFSLREHLNGEQNTELIPFIFLTAADDAQLYQRASSLGIDDYLVKPVDKMKLMHTISRVLERSRQIYHQLTDRVNGHITSALAPRLPDASHGWRLRVAHRHTGIGGGDLLLHKSRKQQMMLVLLDIMGHDDSAKFFAYAYGGFLSGLMHSTNAEDAPGRLLERLSESALQDNLLSQVTLTCCTAILSPDGGLTLASAGHPPPLRITRTHVESLPVGGVLPGLLPAVRYQPETLKVAPGERIALYTDGLFESATDENARRLLEERITGALMDTLDCPLDQSLEAAMGLFDELAGTPPKDDAMLLLIEPIDRHI